jgi:hypothetical protein
MESKESYIKQILKDIWRVGGELLKTQDQDKLRNFVTITINGDVPANHLAINTNLSNGKEGVVIYILTNKRLIKVDIGDKIQSSSFILDSIINIERELLDDDRIQIKILFPNDSFGLRYPATDTQASKFFQSLDQSRVKGD